MNFMGATCLSEELGRLKWKKKKKKNSSESSRFAYRVFTGRSAILNLLTDRVVALEDSQVYT